MEKNRKINLKKGIILLLLLLVCIGMIFAFLPQREESWLGQTVSWEENEDGSYTFVNHTGGRNSTYAWEILDERGNRISFITYSEDNQFTYDLKGDRTLTVKGYTRTGSKTDYSQQSYKVLSSEVIGRKVYEVAGTQLPEDYFSLCLRRIPRAGTKKNLSTEEILLHDGSRWNVDLEIPVDWSCPNIPNRSYGFYVNGFLILDNAINDYCETKNAEIAGVIVDYIIDWVNQNQTYDAAGQWQWHDDATACRVYRMAVIYDVLKEYCSPDEQELILQSMEYQAGILADSRFYTAKHNHGMHQDIALLVYELLHGNDRKTERIQIALGRLDEYLSFAYTSDGIHKEHSPFYGRDVLMDTIFLQKITEKVSPDFSTFAEGIVDGTLSYLTHIIKPDSMWPPIGDSTSEDGRSAVAGIVSSAGKNDLQNKLVPGENDFVFKEGGYGIFRSSWDDPAEEATWMMLSAATFSSTHKHGDDLQVLLYHKGDLITEAGRRNYTYLEEKTAWAYSGYAHNVLIVDDEAYPVKVGKNGFQSVYSEAFDTHIVDYSIEDTKSSVTGYEHRFEGIEQTRTLEYDRISNTVTVTDALNADRNYKGTLLWHVAAGVEVQQNKDTYEFYRDAELVATLDVQAVEYTVELIDGEGEYPYTTWLFDGKEDPVWGKLIKINFRGKQGSTEVQTVFTLK